MATYNRNHTYQDIFLNLGETWTIVGTLNRNNAPIVIDDTTTVIWKLANTKGLIMTVTLENDAAITDPTIAAYKIVVPVSQQLNTPNLNPGLYRYELSVKAGDTNTNIQAEGSCTLNTSLSYQFKS